MKILKKIILSIVLLQINNSFTQNYYQLTADATALYRKNDFKKSSKLWDKAFKLQEGFSGDFYNAACTKALANQKRDAFKYLEKAILKGYEDINWLKKDSDFNNLHETKSWKNFINDIPKLQSKRLQSLNTSLKNELETLRMQDQTLRVLLPDVEKKFGRNSKEYQWFLSTLIKENDDKVLKQITTFIDKHGWLGINEVGELANQTLWLVIQHAPLETQKKYLPILKTSVEQGDSKAWYYAFLKDRILMREGKPQIYGSQARWNKALKKNVIYSIENRKDVNKRRKAVGLETLEDYAKNNGYLLSEK